MKSILAAFLCLALHARGWSVDFAASAFFCPWVHGYEGTQPAELAYFSTTDPVRVAVLLAEGWSGASPAGRLYLLLYARFRDLAAYARLKQEVAASAAVEVEVRNGCRTGRLGFAAAAAKIDVLTYDWAGVPVNWD
jgi:hypothetical protein